MDINGLSFTIKVFGGNWVIYSGRARLLPLKALILADKKRGSKLSEDPHLSRQEHRQASCFKLAGGPAKSSLYSILKSARNQA
ncbi:hypothetical protein NC651_034955 [Populus alba x Populus x berolinensis]|nr:hypothetical protein NC651_034955 [Populus alba x Populus x berolinensis]